VNVDGWSLPVGLGGWLDEAGKLSPSRATGDRVGECGQAQGFSKPCVSSASFPHPDYDGRATTKHDGSPTY
jgi:hypothetical protein